MCNIVGEQERPYFSAEWVKPYKSHQTTWLLVSVGAGHLAVDVLRVFVAIGLCL